MVDLLKVAEEIQDSVGASVRVSLQPASIMDAVVFRFDVGAVEQRWNHAVALRTLEVTDLTAAQWSDVICEKYRHAMAATPEPSALEEICPVPPFPGIRGGGAGE